jgi:hypothetical protein
LLRISDAKKLKPGAHRANWNPAHRFAADGEILRGTKFFRQVRIVEALILAAGQAQDQLLLGKGNGPRHGTSAIAMLYPADGIGLITAFKTLYLAFTQLQPVTP